MQDMGCVDADIFCAITAAPRAPPSAISLSDPTVEYVRPPMEPRLPRPEDVYDILPRPSYPLQGGIFTESPSSCKVEGRVPFDACVRVPIRECAAFALDVGEATMDIVAALKNELRLITEGPAVGGLFCPVQLFNDDLVDVRHAIPGILFAFLRETRDGKIGLWPCNTLRTLDAEFVRLRPVAAKTHAELGAALLEKFADFHTPTEQFKDFRFVCHGQDGENSVVRFDCIEDGCFWLRVDSHVRSAAKMAREIAEKNN